MKKVNPAKEHYQRLRLLSCEELWADEVRAFDAAGPAERLKRVAVVRAVGVVFSESGTPPQKDAARVWLRALLKDPEEKIRRYAMTALPKIGVDAQEEAALLALLEKASSDREKNSLGRTLGMIGGKAALESAAGSRLDDRAIRKIEANVARETRTGEVRLDRRLDDVAGVRLHLRCRTGLEEILADEVDAFIRKGAPFRSLQVSPGLVVMEPMRAFTLADVYALRCFGQLGIAPAGAEIAGGEIAALARAIASPASLRVLQSFTDGPLRYRLEFLSKGHQRAAVRSLADLVYQKCPALLNDPRGAPWQIDIRHHSRGCQLEIVPRLRPDPRFDYRVGDIPAASHPPLAACMARLAEPGKGDIVWDPFCGSGLELIECALLGGVAHCIGTDLSKDALATARANFDSAVKDTPVTFACCDFRDHPAVADLRPGSVSLVVSNPPLGRRVPIPNLSGLISDFLAASSRVLRKGGRLVFVNPVSVQPRGLPLRLDLQRKIDLGGFHCRLEKYTKI